MDEGVQIGDVPLLSISKVVSDGIVGLLKETVICVTWSSFQKLEYSKPISQLQPEANSQISTKKKKKDIHSFNKHLASAYYVLGSILRYWEYTAMKRQIR